MWWFVAVTRIEKESEWSCSEYGGHLLTNNHFTARLIGAWAEYNYRERTNTSVKDSFGYDAPMAGARA